MTTPPEALDPELWESCVQILRSLGLALDSSDTDLVVRKSIQFAEERFEVSYGATEWQRLATRRELLLVLAGGLYGSAIEEAIGRCDEEVQREIAEIVTQEISQPRAGCEVHDAARRKLDPMCWSLRVLDDEDERMLHVSLLAEAARLQERALVPEHEPPKDALRLQLCSVTLEA